jgi:hypothetical protein
MAAKPSRQKLGRKTREVLLSTWMSELKRDMQRNIRIAEVAIIVCLVIGVAASFLAVALLAKLPSGSNNADLKTTIGVWSTILVGLISFWTGILTLIAWALSSIQACRTRCSQIEFELRVADDTEQLGSLLKGFICFTKRPEVASNG